MTHLLFPMFDAFAPLRTLLQRLVEPSRHPTRHTAQRSACVEQAAVAAAAIPCQVVQRPWNAGRNPHRAVRPLRVLRVIETGAQASQSGRMRISGRMADVCAELDRMAEREAAVHAAR